MTRRLGPISDRWKEGGVYRKISVPIVLSPKDFVMEDWTRGSWKPGTVGSSRLQVIHLEFWNVEAEPLFRSISGFHNSILLLCDLPEHPTKSVVVFYRKCGKRKSHSSLFSHDGKRLSGTVQISGIVDLHVALALGTYVAKSHGYRD